MSRQIISDSKYALDANAKLLLNLYLMSIEAYQSSKKGNAVDLQRLSVIAHTMFHVLPQLALANSNLQDAVTAINLAEHFNIDAHYEAALQEAWDAYSGEGFSLKGLINQSGFDKTASIQVEAFKKVRIIADRMQFLKMGATETNAAAVKELQAVLLDPRVQALLTNPPVKGTDFVLDPAIFESALEIANFSGAPAKQEREESLLDLTSLPTKGVSVGTVEEDDFKSAPPLSLVTPMPTQMPPPPSESLLTTNNPGTVTGPVYQSAQEAISQQIKGQASAKVAAIVKAFTAKTPDIAAVNRELPLLVNLENIGSAKSVYDLLEPQAHLELSAREVMDLFQTLYYFNRNFSHYKSMETAPVDSIQLTETYYGKGPKNLLDMARAATFRNPRSFEQAVFDLSTQVEALHRDLSSSSPNSSGLDDYIGRLIELKSALDYMSKIRDIKTSDYQDAIDLLNLQTAFLNQEEVTKQLSQALPKEITMDAKVAAKMLPTETLSSQQQHEVVDPGSIHLPDEFSLMTGGTSTLKQSAQPIPSPSKETEVILDSNAQAYAEAMQEIRDLDQKVQATYSAISSGKAKDLVEYHFYSALAQLAQRIDQLTTMDPRNHPDVSNEIAKITQSIQGMIQPALTEMMGALKDMKNIPLTMPGKKPSKININLLSAAYYTNAKGAGIKAKDMESHFDNIRKAADRILFLDAVSKTVTFGNKLDEKLADTANDSTGRDALMKAKAVISFKVVSDTLCDRPEPKKGNFLGMYKVVSPYYQVYAKYGAELFVGPSVVNSIFPTEEPQLQMTSTGSKDTLEFPAVTVDPAALLSRAIEIAGTLKKPVDVNHIQQMEEILVQLFHMESELPENYVTSGGSRNFIQVMQQVAAQAVLPNYARGNVDKLFMQQFQRPLAAAIFILASYEQKNLPNEKVKGVISKAGRATQEELTEIFATHNPTPDHVPYPQYAADPKVSNSSLLLEDDDNTLGLFGGGFKTSLSTSSAFARQPMPQTLQVVPEFEKAAVIKALQALKAAIEADNKVPDNFYRIMRLHGSMLDEYNLYDSNRSHPNREYLNQMLYLIKAFVTLPAVYEAPALRSFEEALGKMQFSKNTGSEKSPIYIRDPEGAARRLAGNPETADLVNPVVDLEEERRLKEQAEQLQREMEAEQQRQRLAKETKTTPVASGSPTKTPAEKSPAEQIADLLVSAQQLMAKHMHEEDKTENYTAIQNLQHQSAALAGDKGVNFDESQGQQGKFESIGEFLERAENKPQPVSPKPSAAKPKASSIVDVTPPNTPQKQPSAKKTGEETPVLHSGTPGGLFGAQERTSPPSSPQQSPRSTGTPVNQQQQEEELSDDKTKTFG